MACNDVVLGAITTGNTPLGLQLVSGGTKVYVSNFADNNITIIDAATSGTTNINLPSAPREIVWGGNKAWVTLVSVGKVVTINTNTETTGTTINVGTSPFGIARNQFTNYIYVANSASNNVSVIDGSTDSLVTTISVGTGPYGIDYDSFNDRIYVANESSNNVSVIDCSSDTLLTTIVGFSTPYAVRFNPDNGYVYVSNDGDNSVKIIDTGTNTIIGSIGVGDAPYSMGYDSINARLYVSNSNDDTLSVIDTNTNTVCNTIAVGDSPFGVVANTFDSKVYVANAFDGNVLVLEQSPDPSFTPTSTPTLTPTQTPTPDPGCKCLYVDSNIELLATGNTETSLNGIAIYEYTDCYNNLVSYTATTGHGALYFCTKNGVIDNISLTQDDVEYGSGTITPPYNWVPPCVNQVNAAAQVILNGICGGDPCGPGAPTPTPTVTETQTQTPTVTTTNTETPTPTNSETPTPTVTTTNTETPTVTPTNTQTVTVTPTNTETPTVTPTPTQTPPNSPTPTQTQTQTVTPTNTETPTVTPTNTVTNTPTPSITPSDEPFDIYAFKTCCNPDVKFRFSNVTGTLLVGQIFYIGGSFDFDGCAEVIPYESTGPVYSGTGVSFTEQVSCDDMLCAASPCPTPTPSPIVICPCKDYAVSNTNALGVYVGYVDCIGTDREIYIGPLESIQLCACLDSVIGPSGVVITLQGDCPPVTETPAPTPSITPSPTPTPVGCNIGEYCLLTYYPETEMYDGTYYSADTLYNGRTYYTGDTAFIYFTGSTWCLSETLGGECIIVGKTCNGPCPNFSEDFFTSGTCVTTTTTVNPCDIFDFEAYFDCDVSTTTTTTIPCSATSIDVTFSAYTTTTTTADPCIGVGGVITISGYTTTTTTIPTTTTTTTTRDVAVSGDVTYTLVETIFICPGQTYQFEDCDTGTNYYVEPSTNFVSVDLFTDYAYLMTINGVEGCYTFKGVSSVSPNSTVSNVDSWYGECTTCQSNI